METNNLKFLRVDKNGVILSVRIVPNSSQNSVLGYCDEYIKIKITAPAIENKANKQLILYLSELLSIPKTKISFVSGEKSRIKRILLNGKTLSDISQKLSIYDNINS